VRWTNLLHRLVTTVQLYSHAQALSICQVIMSCRKQAWPHGGKHQGLPRRPSQTANHSYTSPCSTAKRAAAVREVTLILL
jgi:hypothetical protein